jgi:hypothetical protein
LEFAVLASFTWVILLLVGSAISGVPGIEAREIIAIFRATIPALDVILLTGSLLYVVLLVVKQLHKLQLPVLNEIGSVSEALIPAPICP